MALLHYLEGIRTPFLDKLMLLITEAGDETVFIIIAMIYLWCMDKFDAYYLLFVGFLGTMFNQVLKVFFKIPRPWVKDPTLKAVEKAIPAATGYSFPSGHTQSAVGTFGVVAITAKKNFIKIIAIILALLVSFSRLYLGVHTPLDVLVSFGIAILLILVFGIIFKKAPKSHKTMHIIFSVLIPLFVLISLILTFTLDITDANLLSGLKTSYKMTGCIIGMFAVYEIDRKHINFETAAPPLVQIIKVVLGLLTTLLVKELCYLIFGIIPFEPLSRFFSYFIMVLYAGAVWPLTFKFFNKLQKR